MRIISGKFKSTKLFIPTDKSTRPLRDVVKESIFNTIAHSNKFSFHLEKKKCFRFIFWDRFFWIRMLV